MEPDRLTLEYTPADDLAGPVIVTVRLGAETIASERIDLQDPEARETLAGKICDGRPGIDPEALRDGLTDLAAQLAGDAKFSPDVQALESRIDSALQGGGPGAIFKDGELLNGLARLAVTDPAGYSALQARLAAGGIRMRDYSHAMKKRIAAAVLEQPAELARGDDGGFFICDGCICRTKLTTFCPMSVELCNFQAEIIDETCRDDGQERRVVIGIAGKLKGGKPLPRIDVAAETFHKMEWVVPGWGTDAIIWPGENRALAPAIQALSKNKTRRTVLVHTGWRQHGGNWLYVHAGGAIGSEGESVSVDLQPPLSRFILPGPVDGDAAIEAIRASLAVLDLADMRLTVPILAAVYRALLGDCDFGLHLAGPSGVFKSEKAALAQQHFGAEMDARHLPGSWSSTANSLELAAFFAKDVVLVVDDFAPQGGNDSQRLHRDADRLFRGQGNQSGRQRMTAAGAIRQAKPPRGLILSTGEEIPRGQSLRARLLILEISPGDIDAARLTECQQHAAAGLYAQATASYLAWLAPKYGDLRDSLKAKISELRSNAAAAADGMHARTLGIVASLAAGFWFFLKFADESGAISPKERARLRSESWQALLTAADAQAAKQATSEPAMHFLRLLAAVLASHRAHIAGIDGDEPENPARWGWRRSVIQRSNFTDEAWQPQGRRIGWTDSESVYLEPDASYSETQKLAAEQNESLSVGAATLRRRLKERGFLASEDSARQTLLVRRKLEGGTKNVLHLLAAVVFPDGPEGSDNPTFNPTSDGQNPTSAQGATRHWQNPTSGNPTSKNPVFSKENAPNVGFVGIENPLDRNSDANYSERETGEF